MLKLIFRILSLLSILILNGCSSIPIVYQDKEGLESNLSSAYINKQSAYICSKKYVYDSEHDKYITNYSCYTFKILNNPNIWSFLKLEPQNSDKSDKEIFKEKEEILLIYLTKSDEKIKLYYSPIKLKNNEYAVIECKIKGINSDILEISTDDKYNIKMIDGSQIIGEISGVNVSTGDLLIKTKIKTFEIKSKLISSISASTISINLILIDGTQLKGTLVREDENGVCIENILGEDTYPRNKIHKIIYLK